MRVRRKYIFIYLIENNINSKKYVGFHSTDNLEDGYMGGGIALKKAYKKYKKKNFTKSILEFCELENWQEREQFWIQKIDTYKNGYNMTLGGEGTPGINFSDESIAKMKKTRIERGLAKGKSNGMFGNNHFAESKRKMGQTRKERGVAKGKNNPRFDHTIYKFINIETNEIFEGCKFDLANKIGGLSYNLHLVITGRCNHHKKWTVI